jgi:D-aminopeptidase
MHTYRKTIDTSLETDVLVIGGGPAGAIAAISAARELIRQKAWQAVERAAEFKSYCFQAPYTLEWDCNDHNIATTLARVLGAELVPWNTVRYVHATSFHEMYNMLITWRTLLRSATANQSGEILYAQPH